MRRLALLASLAVPLSLSAQEVYSHPDGYFQIVPPAGWVSQVTYNGMEFQTAFRPRESPADDPETALRVLFVPLAEDADRKELAGQVADLTREVARGLLDPETGKPTSERAIQVAGQPAHEIDVAQVNGAGTAVRGRVVGTVGSSAVFFLIYYTPETAWGRLASEFARAVESFRVVIELEARRFKTRPGGDRSVVER